MHRRRGIDGAGSIASVVRRLDSTGEETPLRTRVRETQSESEYDTSCSSEAQIAQCRVIGERIDDERLVIPPCRVVPNPFSTCDHVFHTEAPHTEPMTRLRQCGVSNSFDHRCVKARNRRCRPISSGGPEGRSGSCHHGPRRRFGRAFLSWHICDGFR